MRWFKHLSAAHADDALAAILEEMGPTGYGIYWLLLEHFAAVMEKDCTAVPELTHSEAKWANICCCSARTFRKFTQRAAELLLISCKTLAELRQYSGRTLANRLQIGIPKLLKYRDEYSQRSGVSREKLPARSETERDTDTEQIRTEHPPTPRKRAAEKSVCVESSPRFDEWFTLWGSVRSTNNKIQACHAWVSIVTPTNEDACFACTRSYIAAHDGPNGFNADNFLFVHAREGFAARWPPKARNPSLGEDRIARASAKFAERMNEVLEEKCRNAK